MCCKIFKLILKSKIKLESGNQKSQIWPPGCHNHSNFIGNLAIATKDMHMKFESEIPKQTEDHAAYRRTDW